MKKIYILAVFVLIPLLGYGQKKPVKVFSDTEQGNLSFQRGTLSLSSSSFTTDEANRIALRQARIVDGDLVIDFNLNEFRKRENGMRLEVAPFVYTPGGYKITPHPKDIGGDFDVKHPVKPVERQLIWKGFLDNYHYKDGPVKIRLMAQLLGPSPVDCDRGGPAFGWEKQKKYLAVAGSGIGLILGGAALVIHSDNRYDEYRKEVFRGAENADNIFNAASNNRNLGNILMITGSGVFIVNAVIYTVNLIKYKKNKSDFDYYCDSPGDSGRDMGFRLKPYIQSGPFDDSVGLQLTFRF